MRRGIYGLLLLSTLYSIYSLWTLAPQLTKIGNDEWSYLAFYDPSTDYRPVTYWRQFQNSYVHPKTNPFSFIFRWPIHRLFGFGAEWGRPFSVMQFVFTGISSGLGAWWFGSSVFTALFIPALFLSFPPVLFFATTVRAEQDILFFGFVTLLLLASTILKKSTLRLGAAMFLAAMLPMIHPMGISFALAAGALILFIQFRYRFWSWKRFLIVSFGAGLLPPLMTLAYYGLDWNATKEFFAASTRFHLAHGSARIDKYALRFASEFGIAMPQFLRGLAGGLFCDYGAFLSLGGNVFGEWLRRVWFLAASVGTVVLALSWRKALASSLFPLTGSWLAVAWVGTLVSVVYPPNTDYAIYSLAGLCLFSILIPELLFSERKYLKNLAILGGLVVLGMQHAYARNLFSRLDLSPNRAVLGQLKAMDEMARRLEMDKSTTGLVYTDLSSWRAGKTRSSPLFEILIAEVVEDPLPATGAVTSPDWYSGFVEKSSSAIGNVDPVRRWKKAKELFQPLQLQGLLFTEGLGLRYFLTDQAKSLQVAVLTRSGQLDFYRPEHFGTKRLTAQRPKEALNWQLPLSAGLHLFQIKGAGVHVSQWEKPATGEVLFTEPLSFFPHEKAGSILLLRMDKNMDAVNLPFSIAGEGGPIELQHWQLASISLN